MAHLDPDTGAKNDKRSFIPSVVDPDMYVFGPPGSGSVIICTDLDPDPSIKKQKSKKILDF
jgi:hypothetical protein